MHHKHVERGDTYHQKMLCETKIIFHKKVTFCISKVIFELINNQILKQVLLNNILRNSWYITRNN